MGKYMRKAKISADVAVMEVSQSALGVRTRAKTLALQRLQSSPSATASAPTLSGVPDSSCYLQLRSRRLEKPSPLKPQFQQKPSSRKETCHPESQAKPNARSKLSDSVNSGSITPPEKEQPCLENRVAEQTAQEFDLGVEASFGENNLDSEPRERNTRESTPCSLIRDVDAATPGSSTRRSTVNAVNQTNRSAFLENIPSASEIEEFFAKSEQQQQHRFIEKYNFDVINDVPLPGRYEWVRVNR